MKMPKWSVLMTTAQYIAVEADSPEDAELVALGLYDDGEVIPELPSFLCEEADLIEEKQNA
jgi:hypothetical protein